MKKIRLESGLIAHQLDKAEQDKLWDELSQDVSVIGKGIQLFTPRDNKAYTIESEIETSFQKYEAVIIANGKRLTVKYNICNQDAKIYKAVRSAFL